MITAVMLIIFKAKGGFIERFLLWALFDLVLEGILLTLLIQHWR